MSHAVAIVKARGDGTREKREFDNRRQVARPRVRAREILGEREETRRSAKRFPRCGRSVFGCICHPTRQEQTRDSRFGPGGKICSAAAAAFRVLFISRSPIAAPRQRHAAPRAGVPFPTMAGALTLHGGLAAAAPAKLASQVRASRGAPVAPDASAKTRIAPAARAVLDGRVLQGTRTSDDEPPADRDPHRTRRPLSPPTRSSKPVAAAGHLASRRGPLRRARADRLRRAVRRKKKQRIFRRRILLLRPRPRPPRRRGFRAASFGCRERRLGHRGERGGSGRRVRRPRAFEGGPAPADDARLRRG